MRYIDEQIREAYEAYRKDYRAEWCEYPQITFDEFRAQEIEDDFFHCDCYLDYVPEGDYDLECGFDPYEGCYTFDC